ncbi:MAG: MFS transporter [Streptosporangiaceae bacterium]|jgi:CP family cyanate transporter-like MFS transporter
MRNSAVQESPGRRARVARRFGGGALLLAGILLLAVNLRAAITSLPPIFPELRDVLHISTAEEATLASVPVLCFGLFSGAAAPLSRMLGEERVLGAALALLAGGLLLRSADPPVLLFPGTIVASAAIALMNVLLPSLIKRRRPERAGLLIGLYLLSLSGGAVVGALIAVPVFTAAGAGTAAARLSLGMWALPALLAAAMWLPQLRYRTLPPAPAAGGQRRRGVLAMGRHALAWQVLAFMGLQSLSYYATLSWFPTLFRDRGMSAAAAGGLLALMNLGNAVTALLIPVLAQRARDQRLLAVISMMMTGAGLAGAAFGPLGAAAPLVFLLGLGQGASLGLGIFYTMARAPDPVAAAALSAFAQSGGYLLASTGPLLIGLLHSVTGGWAVPVGALLGVVVLQLITGWLAGRARTVPVPGPVPLAAPEGAGGRRP